MKSGAPIPDAEQIREEIPDAHDETSIPALALPALWGKLDYIVVAATKIFLAAAGLAFTLMVLTEVGSRFLLNASVAQANSVSRFLLVWFFMIGAGLALRKGAHIGLEILVRQLPARGANALGVVVALVLLGFFGVMAVGGWGALLSSLRQRDAALQVSMGWVMAAYPIGFGLLAYHQAALLADRLGGRGSP